MIIINILNSQKKKMLSTASSESKNNEVLDEQLNETIQQIQSKQQDQEIEKINQIIQNENS